MVWAQKKLSGGTMVTASYSGDLVVDYGQTKAEVFTLLWFCPLIFG